MAKKSLFKTLQERNAFIVKERRKGTPNAEVASKTELSIRQVQNVNAAYKQSNRLGRKKGSGRKGTLSKEDKVKIRNTLRRNPYKSIKALASSLSHKVSARSISRYLKEIGWTRKKATRTPKLTDQQKDRRVDWAENHAHTRWNQVIFSDECNFSLNECRYGWAPRGSRIQQESLADNPKVQVWGAISSKGPITFQVDDGNMTSKHYIEILDNEFVDEAYEIMGNRWVFQQDRAKAHTAKSSMKFLEDNVPNVLDWPPNSCDLSPIENLWGTLKQRVYSRNPEEVEDLRMCIEEEIDHITKKECQDLFRTMKDRVAMVIETEGNAIDW